MLTAPATLAPCNERACGVLPRAAASQVALAMLAALAPAMSGPASSPGRPRRLRQLRRFLARNARAYRRLSAGPEHHGRMLHLLLDEERVLPRQERAPFWQE